MWRSFQLRCSRFEQGMCFERRQIPKQRRQIPKQRRQIPKQKMDTIEAHVRCAIPSIYCRRAAVVQVCMANYRIWPNATLSNVE